MRERKRGMMAYLLSLESAGHARETDADVAK